MATVFGHPVLFASVWFSYMVMGSDLGAAQAPPLSEREWQPSLQVVTEQAYQTRGLDLARVRRASRSAHHAAWIPEHTSFEVWLREGSVVRNEVTPAEEVGQWQWGDQQHSSENLSRFVVRVEWDLSRLWYHSDDLRWEQWRFQVLEARQALAETVAERYRAWVACLESPPISSGGLDAESFTCRSQRWSLDALTRGWFSREWLLWRAEPIPRPAPTPGPSIPPGSKTPSTPSR